LCAGGKKRRRRRVVVSKKRKRERARKRKGGIVVDGKRADAASLNFTLLGQLELPSTPSLPYIEFLSGLHITMEAGIKGRICRPGPISLVLWPEGQILDSYTYDGLYAASGDWHP
jgi:hypothetical protein